ncbi:hypothetical protein DEM27_28800 [Metarhizobium album]|uniref:Uncharacterized protein n=1 Tax=Metarhizobium album TaxID=2182425 RepID=A0A2U2DHQ0_9HYPH|nr:hypothetical protein [Rhizobium album]PWE52804.1 hypothetical protein DEM27_28800 [Rhizobium album]
MLTEIQIEDVGTYRPLNMWQLERVMRIRGPNRHLAILAVGLGMSLKQFKKLPLDKQDEVQRAYSRLVATVNMP